VVLKSGGEVIDLLAPLDTGASNCEFPATMLGWRLT
jgi:hypothetical protein